MPRPQTLSDAHAPRRGIQCCGRHFAGGCYMLGDLGDHASIAGSITAAFTEGLPIRAIRPAVVDVPRTGPHRCAAGESAGPDRLTTFLPRRQHA